MLALPISTPAAARFGARSLSSILASGRSPILSAHDQSVPGVSLHHVQTAIALHDSSRPYSCAFPARALTFSDRLQRPLYALRIQTLRKATLPADPERPKRPLSAYLRFAAVHREKQGVKDVKQIAEAWRQLAPAAKQPFAQAYEADKAVYTKDFDSYKASGKLDAWKRDPAKPKRPLTPYLDWAQQKRQEHNIAKLPVTEASKVLGAAWAELSADKKAPLEAKFKAAKEKYDIAAKAYKDSGAETAWLKKTGRLEIMQKAEAKKQAQKDKIKAAKTKKLAQKDKVAKAKASKAKLSKAKAAKAKAAKAKAAAAKTKAAKLKAAKAKAAKAKALKVKTLKAKAAEAKLAKAKAAKAKTLKAKAAKAAKAKAAKEKALKAKAAKAAKAKAAKEKALKAKAAKAKSTKAKAAKAKAAKAAKAKTAKAPKA